jgi:FtsH-binding integral membrane protein
MPLLALAFLGAALVASLASGWLGIAGRALAGGISMMFALQGLALVHVATREKQGRPALLALTYLFTILLGHILLPILAVAGMIDTATPFRRRLARNHKPSGRNGPPPLN